jgi:hypothetical protein
MNRRRDTIGSPEVEELLRIGYSINMQRVVNFSGEILVEFRMPR